MTRYFCDRCGCSMINKPEIILMSKSFAQCGLSSDKDLCYSCIRALVEWLKPLAVKQETKIV